MTLTRNEKIAIGLGIAGAAAVGVLLELSERHAPAALRTATVTYLGDGNPTHQVQTPFMPQIIVVFPNPEGTGVIETFNVDLANDRILAQFPVNPSPPLSPISAFIAPSSVDVGSLSRVDGQRFNTAGLGYELVLYA